MIDQGVIFCGEDFVIDDDGDRDVGVGEGFKDVVRLNLFNHLIGFIPCQIYL